LFNNTTIQSILLIVFLTISGSSFAHGLVTEVSLEEIQFKVGAVFADGTSVADATVEVKNDAGEILATGKTDSNGQYVFEDRFDSALEIVVEDLTGHRETFPLSPAAVAMVVKGKATPLEHAHGDGEHNHDHSPSDGSEETDDHSSKSPKTILSSEASGRKGSEIISGLGYVLGITGILFYWLGMRQKTAA